MRKTYTKCTEPRVLKKAKKTGPQNRLLLSVLLDRLGQPVPLQELLLLNGLRNATSRRLRELEVEHGHFSMRLLHRLLVSSRANSARI